MQEGHHINQKWLKYVLLGFSTAYDNESIIRQDSSALGMPNYPVFYYWGWQIHILIF